LRKSASILTDQQDRDDEDKSEGFWREFFLLKPDNVRFGQLLDDLEAIDLLHASVRILWYGLPELEY
jgi:hypothetical protein